MTDTGGAMIREQQLNLQAYAVDPTNGFLPAEDPLQALPPAYAEWDGLAADIPAMLLTGTLRRRLEAMAVLDLDALNGERELERAMLVLSLLGTAYIWAETEPATVLPAPIARPWWTIAQLVGRPPITAHGSLVLNNWRRLDPAGPLTLDNLDTLVTFLNGSDERWFYLVTVAIEAAGTPALVALVQAQQAVAFGDSQDVVANLVVIEAALVKMLAILERMPEHCDPYIFYHRVRPYLSSWPDEGVLYLEADLGRHRYSGGSAAQSSLIQSLDVALGIRHASPFLADMRNYMPPKHRQFIDAVEHGPDIRAFVAERVAEEPELADRLNACVDLLDAFRRIHMELSVRYIKQQAPSDETAIGTGGTDFVPLLSEARKETRAARF